jgi:site-specific DNA-methyltransferase (adenine-specific)
MSAPEPYWADDRCQLFLGDCREVLPALGVTADCIVADPPYGETSLAWDRWPDGWLETAAGVTSSLWCFGSLRLYLERAAEFRAARWRLSQDLIWEKHNGSGFHSDRFRRVHEQATHWYTGDWRNVHADKAAITEVTGERPQSITRGKTPHFDSSGGVTGQVGATVLMRSVLRVHSMHGRAIHPTEKPVGILDPLLRYSCPVNGLVIDPFAGSGSTLDAARCSGRRAIGIEADEKYIELAARRLAQADLFGGAA